MLSSGHSLPSFNFSWARKIGSSSAMMAVMAADAVAAVVVILQSMNFVNQIVAY